MTGFTTSGVRAPLRLLACSITAGLPVLLAAVTPNTGDHDAVNRLRYGPGVANHPVGVVPSSAVSIPADWPLGADGTITCLSCHYQLPSLRGTSNPRLRGDAGAGKAGSEFCASCHSVSNDRSAAGMHWTAVRVAHVRPDTHGSDNRGGLLDAESRRCLSCHDGVSAGESTNPTASSSRGFEDMRRNHPVGVTYGDQGRGRTLLRSAQLLPERVRLPDGKVSCVSCHDLYETERNRLSVSMDKSRLCLTCHDRK